MSITAWPLCLLLALALAVVPSTEAQKVAGALAVFATSPLAGAAIVSGVLHSSMMIGVQLVLVMLPSVLAAPGGSVFAGVLDDVQGGTRIVVVNGKYDPPREDAIDVVTAGMFLDSSRVPQLPLWATVAAREGERDFLAVTDGVSGEKLRSWGSLALLSRVIPPGGGTFRKIGFGANNDTFCRRQHRDRQLAGRRGGATASTARPRGGAAPPTSPTPPARP